MEPEPIVIIRPRPGRGRRWRGLLEDRSLLVVVAAAALWTAIMYLHVWRRHDRFATFDHDLGFHDHYIWLLARGKSFSTVLGLEAFGHNATFGYLLFAPLSWLGFGPQSLNFVLTVALAGAAPVLYLLAKERTGHQGAAMAVSLAWLLHPVVQLNVWETWHPEVMAIVPLFAAELARRRQRWGVMVALLCFAVIWKTDISLAVVGFGLVMMIGGQRRRGAWVVGGAALWFALCSMVIVPRQADGATVYGPLFGDLGDTPAEVAKTAITDPMRVVERIDEHEPVRYTRDLAVPYALVSFLSPSALLVGLPQALVNLLSYANFTWDFRVGPHYQVLPVVALTLAAVDALARLTRRRPHWVEPAATMMLAAAAGSTVAWGALWPLSSARGRWAVDGDPQRPAVEAALALVGSDASVSAPYTMVPHLTHREVVYVYPNPWRSSYYGTPETEPPPVGEVQFIVMNSAIVPPDGPQRVLWECLTTSPAFVERMNLDSIVVLERVDGRLDDQVCQTWLS